MGRTAIGSMALGVLIAVLGCGGGSHANGTVGGGGGQGAGGASSGGQNSSGGSATGGQSQSGGSSQGGSGTGGSATGGSATGGSATGGSATGGSATGGSATGGSATGGSATGGSATGGSATGGTGGTTSVCNGNCHFVRAGANGNGSDWSNALAALPAQLKRGDTYYVAAGTYAEYTFDDAASAASVITIVHATAASHGTDTGWQSSYGASVAQFASLSFKSPYYVFDGQTAGGFEVIGDFQSDGIGITGNHVTIRNTDVNGNFGTDSTGYHNRGACTGISISADYVSVTSSTIHDVADDGVSISGASYVDFTGDVIHALHACGTDGGCGPCYNGHSDGFETYNVKHSRFIGNFVYDVRSTSTFFFGNWADTLGNGPSEYCEDMTLENNVMYAPEVGLVAYIQDAVGVYVYNNVFWGVRQGSYGGLSVGNHITNLQLYNNVILSINLAHVGATFDPAQMHGDYNLFGVSLGQWTNGAHDKVAADPGFVAIPDINGARVTAPKPTDFVLKATSPCVNAGYAGDATIVIPKTDFAGATRDSKPDIGAFEH